MRSVIYAGALTLVASSAVAQSARAPQFDAADVHVSVKSPQMFMRVNPPRNGRYEIKNATMLDLVRTAYGMTADRVVGGPNWLELDRFDIIAKVPDAADADAAKAMLQALLADRFKLWHGEKPSLCPVGSSPPARSLV